jgi:Arc/MetJ-type ribon-helix-helix transcriptional regulator
MDDKGDERRRTSGEARVQTLRAALVEGEQSGLSAPFDFDSFVKNRRSLDKERGRRRE